MPQRRRSKPHACSGRAKRGTGIVPVPHSMSPSGFDAILGLWTLSDTPCAKHQIACLQVPAQVVTLGFERREAQDIDAVGHDLLSAARHAAVFFLDTAKPPDLPD